MAFFLRPCVLCIAAFVFTAHASPIHWNVDLITDFSAPFTADAANFASDLPQFRVERGDLSLDIMKRTLRVNMDVRSDPGIRLQASSSVQLTFDGERGYVALTVKQSHLQLDQSPPLDADGCVKVNFPVAMLPPGQVLKNAYVGEITNVPPHEDIDLNGQALAAFGDECCVYVHRRDNGAGVAAYKRKEATIHQDISDVVNHASEPFLAFGEWKAGAGTFDEVACVSSTGSAQQVIARSDVDAALVAAETLLTKFFAAHGNHALVSMYVQMPSVLRSAAASGRASPSSDVVTDSTGKITIFGGVVAVSMVSASISACVASMLLMNMKKRNGQLSAPLCSV